MKKNRYIVHFEPTLNIVDANQFILEGVCYRWRWVAKIGQLILWFAGEESYLYHLAFCDQCKTFHFAKDFNQIKKGIFTDKDFKI